MNEIERLQAVRKAVYDRQVEVHEKAQKIYLKQLKNISSIRWMFHPYKMWRLDREWNEARTLHRYLCEWHSDVCDQLDEAYKKAADEPPHMLQYGKYPMRSKSWEDTLNDWLNP